jgi:hypothetical protein
MGKSSLPRQSFNSEPLLTSNFGTIYGVTMRKTAVGFFAVAAACTIGAATSSTQAATPTLDLAMTGSVVAGVSGGQSGQEIPFTFTMTNKSTSTSANVAFVFTVTNGATDSTDYVCPLVSNHYNINPDTPACEVGTLPTGRSTQAAILVTAKATGTMTVRACAINEANLTDPVSTNNCKTLRLPIS